MRDVKYEKIMAHNLSGFSLVVDVSCITTLYTLNVHLCGLKRCVLSFEGQYELFFTWYMHMSLEVWVASPRIMQKIFIDSD